MSTSHTTDNSVRQTCFSLGSGLHSGRPAEATRTHNTNNLDSSWGSAPVDTFLDRYDGRLPYTATVRDLTGDVGSAWELWISLDLSPGPPQEPWSLSFNTGSYVLDRTKLYVYFRKKLYIIWWVSFSYLVSSFPQCFHCHYVLKFSPAVSTYDCFQHLMISKFWRRSEGTPNSKDISVVEVSLSGTCWTEESKKKNFFFFLRQIQHWENTE